MALHKRLKRYHISTLLILNFVQTTIHKFYVLKYILSFCFKLMRRAIVHDLSKYSKHEAPIFARNIRDLKTLEFGSKDYKNNLKILDKCLNHHYSHNSHHPQHFKGGFEEMSFLDRMEMIIDWIAATKRTKGGDINKSLVINKSRFNISEEDYKWLNQMILAILYDI